MDFMKTTGIVFFVLFGPIWAAAGQIKTYQDVENGTLFVQGTAPEQPKPVSEQQLKDVEKTYAIYAENHLVILEHLTKRPHTVDYKQPITVNLQMNAQRVYTNCWNSLRNHKISKNGNGRPVPGWLPMFLDVLKDVSVENYRVAFKKGETTQAKTIQIQNSIKASDQRGGMLWPGTESHENVKRFVRQNSPFLVLLFDQREYFDKSLKDKRCANVEWNNIFDVRNNTILTECETLTFLLYLAQSLLELQIIVDLNKNILPYNDPSGGSSSGTR